MSQHENRISKARGDEGFTLIELMVVISILGILAGLAIPRLQVYRAEAKKIEAVAFGRQVLNSLTVHAANDLRGEYPLIASCEQFEMLLAEVGSPLSAKDRENYCTEGTEMKNPLCECKDAENQTIGWDCGRPIPSECVAGFKYAWYEISYFVPMNPDDLFLMISTDGTTQVITEDEIPTVGFAQ